MARIGIDARFFGSVGKGLGRYTQKLIENLEKISTIGEDQYFIFLRKENFDEYQPKNVNFQKVLSDYRWYTISEQLNMPHILNSYKLDLVHFPHFNVPVLYRGKFVVTIHDLILIHFPTVRNSTRHSFWYRLKYLAYKMVIKSAIRRSEKVVAVSEFTKKDILEHYRILNDKIKVIYEAAEGFTPVIDQDEVLLRYGIIKPYILYVGNAYPHKNLEALVSVFKEIKKIKKDLNLVLVGKEDFFYLRLKDRVKRNNIKGVIFTGFVDDKDMDAVYRSSELYVFPSLYEGFGLPALEAMAKGVPVACSGHPCMREILGDSAYYFNGKKEKNMAGAIMNVLNDEKIKKELSEKGYQRVKKFSWDKMAEETLILYEELLRQKNS
jgi:glycosyltransferase involved in cell wall biosynthesis